MDNNRLVPSHAVKQGRRYRSYVTQQYAEASNGQAQPSPTLRLPAGNLERVVQERLKSFLSDPKALLNAPDGITDAAAHQRAFVQARQVADTWDQLATAARRGTCQRL